MTRIAFAFLAMAVVFASGCSSGRLKLSPSDNEANQHMVEAMRLNNEVTAWLNDLGNGRPQGIRVGDVDQKALRTNIDKLTSAATHARAVSPDFLRRADPEFPQMWQGEFIPAVEGRRDYYGGALANPAAPPPPEKLIAALAHGDRYGTWYDAHIQSIRDGIQRQAKPT
jgi:hypothetical protein